MWLYNISRDISWGIMSSYRDYSYQDYAPEVRHSRRTAPKLKAVPSKKTKTKNPFGKIVVLLLLLYFVLFPAFKNVYEYSFINKLLNSNIKADANRFFEQAENLFANTGLFNRNFVGKVELVNPQMEQLDLNYEMTNLKNNIRYILNQYPRLEAGIFVYDYQTKNYVSINGDKQIPAASIIKVPILLQMFKRIESGQLSLYEKFKMTPYYRTGGSGYLQYRPDGSSFEMYELAQYMIRTSDNTATNMILSAVGGAHEMNAALRNWGFSKTYIKTWLPDLYGTNLTTPKDMATILYNADNPEFLSLENRSKIVEIMSKVKNTSLLKQGIPDSAQLIHKTGDVGEMLGDAGVVTMPDGRRYIITVMVKRRWNDYSARNLINQISATVYNSFAANNL